MLEKTLESPLDCKEIQLVHPKRDQSWVFIEKIDVEAETPILWPPDAKSWLIWKDPDAGRDGGRRRRGQQKMRWLDGITDSMDMGLGGTGIWWLTGRPGVLRFMGSQRVGHDWVTELELKLFWLCNIKNLSFIRSWNQVVWVLAGFESHPDWFESQTWFWLDLSPSTWAQVPVCGKKFQCL